MRLPKLLTGSDQSYPERVLRMLASMLGFQASIWLAYWLLWFLHVFEYRGLALSFYVWGVFVGGCVAGVMFRAVLARSDKIKAETEAKLTGALKQIDTLHSMLSGKNQLDTIAGIRRAAEAQYPVLYKTISDEMTPDERAQVRAAIHREDYDK